jgi:hypothetical protein
MGFAKHYRSIAYIFSKDELISNRHVSTLPVRLFGDARDRWGSTLKKHDQCNGISRAYKNEQRDRNERKEEILHDDELEDRNIF